MDELVRKEAEILACYWSRFGNPIGEIAIAYVIWRRRAKQAKARVKELEEAIRTAVIKARLDQELWSTLGEED